MKKLPLILILFIGVFTPLASTALYFLWSPDAHTNIGELLPVQRAPLAAWQVAADDWQGQWLLLTAAELDERGECNEACQQQVCRAHTLRLILPGAYVRLQPLWLVRRGESPSDNMPYPSDCREGTEQTQARVKDINIREGVALIHGELSTLPAGHKSGALYLIDPDKNWAMRFSKELTLYDIRKDVKKLTRLSKGRKFFKDN